MNQTKFNEIKNAFENLKKKQELIDVVTTSLREIEKLTDVNGYVGITISDPRISAHSVLASDLVELLTTQKDDLETETTSLGNKIKLT